MTCPLVTVKTRPPCCNGKEKIRNKTRQIDEHKYKSWSSEEEVTFYKCPEQRFVGETFNSHLLKAIVADTQRES